MKKKGVTTKVGANPFTPRSGQEPKTFIGRDKELKIFNKVLDTTKRKQYNHFVVLGNWGTGKTTLLKEFRKQAQLQQNLCSFVSVYEFTDKNLIAPTLHLLTQIPRNLPIKYERIKSFTKHMQGIGITLPIIGGGLEIGERKKYEGDTQTLLTQGLLELWKSIKDEVNTVVVFLDDVQNYYAVPEFMSVLKNVLSDEEIVEQTGFLFVLATTENGWTQFLKKFHPIGRYFVPVLKLSQFSREQTKHIVEKSLINSGVSFSKEIFDYIYDYSEGHPYQIQILCSYLYENQLNGKVNVGQFDTSITQTIDELGSIILDPLYSAASEQEKTVIKSISSSYRIYSFDEILELVKKEKINKNTLSSFLSRLTEKGLLLKVERGKYQIVSRLFYEFLKRQ